MSLRDYARKRRFAETPEPADDEMNDIDTREIEALLAELDVDDLEPAPVPEAVWAGITERLADGWEFTFPQGTPPASGPVISTDFEDGEIAEFDSEQGYGLGLNVFWSNRVSTEFAASVVEPDLALRATDPSIPSGVVGGLEMMPLTATLQFHFNPDGRFDPGFEILLRAGFAVKLHRLNEILLGHRAAVGLSHQVRQNAFRARVLILGAFGTSDKNSLAAGRMARTFGGERPIDRHLKHRGGNSRMAVRVEVGFVGLPFGF